MSKQQTAAEWLLDKLVEILGDKCNELSVEQTLRNHYAIQQATQMNREQIEQAFIKGNEFVPKWKINGVPYIESEQYYEQTYGTPKSR
jgi:hypothetical protein